MGIKMAATDLKNTLEWVKAVRPRWASPVVLQVRQQHYASYKSFPHTSLYSSGDLFVDPFGTTTYSQIGRFNTSGYIHNGVRIPSGVDWLDYLGSTKNSNARTGFCFNSVPNMPPIFKGAPSNGKVTIPCGNNLEEYKVRWPFL
jgi:hypothetical protein